MKYTLIDRKAGTTFEPITFPTLVDLIDELFWGSDEDIVGVVKLEVGQEFLVSEGTVAIRRDE